MFFVYLLSKRSVMTTTIKINRRSKQAKILFEYLKTLPFVEISENEKADFEKSEKKVLSVKEKNKQIKEFSKKVNKAAAKRWFDELRIDL